MGKKAATFGLIAIALAATGCASDKAGTQSTADQAAIVNAADWSKAQVVEVDLANYSFAPSNLSFQHDQPYQLHLINKSDHTHTFSSDTFFKAIAMQKMTKNGANVSTADLVENIELAPGDQVDLYFIANKAGNYDLYCAKFMHETMGMHGQITVM